MLEQAAYPRRTVSPAHTPATDPIPARYRMARDRARRGQLWSKVMGGARDLLSLKDVVAACTVVAQRDAGRRLVPMAQVRGSEGRSDDFDRDFNPLKDYTRNRWLGIARARERGKVLPPVSLVQVGGVYFVTDGHHRISVASAFGQEEIEARVTVWEVEGELPWERAPRHTDHLRGMLSRRLRRADART